MGMDLICFIAKGPTKFKKSDIRKAQKAAEKVIEYAKLLNAAVLEDSKAEPALTPEQEHLLANGLDHELLQGFNGQEQYSSVDEAENEVEEMAEASAAVVVKEFTDWWTEVGGSARDTCTRVDPDDRKQKIVVCGDMSGGDCPDGEGYNQMRRAYWYGIADKLGIR